MVVQWEQVIYPIEKLVSRWVVFIKKNRWLYWWLIFANSDMKENLDQVLVAVAQVANMDVDQVAKVVVAKEVVAHG